MRLLDAVFSVFFVFLIFEVRATDQNLIFAVCAHVLCLCILVGVSVY